MQYPFDENASFEELIPEEFRDLIAGLKVVEAAFGAGPGFVASKRWHYDPPVVLKKALEDLDARRDVLRRCHVQLSNGARLVWERHQFFNYYPPERRGEKAPSVADGGGVLRRSYVFEDFDQWDDTLFESIEDFADAKGVHPNIMSASMEVYNRIDQVVQNHRDNVFDDSGNHPAEDVEFSLAAFTCENATVDFTINEITKSPHFLLIYDEDPEFDGEPEFTEGKSFACLHYRIA